MNRFEIKLIELAYKNYLKTNDTYFEVSARNGDELFYFTNAAESLSNSGHIIPLSENIGATTISIDSSGLCICYELTDLGLQYGSKNFISN